MAKKVPDEQKEKEVGYVADPKAVLQYPKGANYFKETQDWATLNFIGNHKGGGLIEVTEIKGLCSLKDFFTPEMIGRFESSGVRVKLNWK